MNEAMLDRTVKMLHEERLERAERARLVQTAVIHRASRKAVRPKTPRTVCRRFGQVAY
jgi:hypothetical protein